MSPDHAVPENRPVDDQQRLYFGPECRSQSPKTNELLARSRLESAKDVLSALSSLPDESI